jgi:hypothetical protein
MKIQTDIAYIYIYWKSDNGRVPVDLHKFDRDRRIKKLADQGYARIPLYPC